jgi:hypothetical protein
VSHSCKSNYNSFLVIFPMFRKLNYFLPLYSNILHNNFPFIVSYNIKILFVLLLFCFFIHLFGIKKHEERMSFYDYNKLCGLLQLNHIHWFNCSNPNRKMLNVQFFCLIFIQLLSFLFFFF